VSDLAGQTWRDRMDSVESILMILFVGGEVVLIIAIFRKIILFS
jgi:hypothetical protein